jgi:broad specificity phosphatase PhoE
MNIFTKLFGKKSPVKRIYFVRHGETILNAQRVRQGAEGALSEKGRTQAQATGERLKNFPIDIMLVSPFERTQETAGIINEIIHKPFELNDLLKERKNPTEIIGKWYDDVEVRHIIDRIDKSFHEGNLRYSDEENYEDLKARAEQLLDYLATRPEKNILCVTHGIFLTMVIAVIQYRNKLTPMDYARLAYHNPATNAGITVCALDPSQVENPDKGWSLIAWNDYTRKA